MTLKLTDIETLTESYGGCRAQLAEHVKALHDEIEQAKRLHLPAVRIALGATVAAHDKLHAALKDSRALFSKPKTQVFSGIRVGYMKQRGKVVIDDDEAVIKRIRDKLPAKQAELLIKVTETVDKQAVGTLIADDLKRLGVEITADSDVVTIKPVDGEVDKLVAALLKDAEHIDEEATP